MYALRTALLAALLPLAACGGDSPVTTTQATPTSRNLVTGQAVLPAGQYVAMPFTIDRDSDAPPVGVLGDALVQGTQSIGLYVLTASAYQAFKSNATFTAIYQNAAHASGANLPTVEVEGGGLHYFVLDNSANAGTSTTVLGTVRVSWLTGLPDGQQVNVTVGESETGTRP